MHRDIKPENILMNEISVLPPIAIKSLPGYSPTFKPDPGLVHERAKSLETPENLINLSDFGFAIMAEQHTE